MDAGKPSLDDLRREIDDIDAALHDLLMRRTELVQRIGAAKGDNAVYVRPAREAQVLRRLVARHRGAFPKAVVVHIWRSIFSVFAGLQGPLAVAVHTPDDGPDLRALARDHFGPLTPLTSQASALGAVGAVTAGRATLGVLPLPQSDDSDPWWRLLFSDGEDTPRIVSRLPFATATPSLGDGVDALAVALAPYEASGSDRSFLVAETAEPVSRDALVERLGNAGISVLDIIHWDQSSGPQLHLIEVEGFLDAADARLSSLAEGADEGFRCGSIGGYPVPLTEQELAATGVGSED